MPVDPTPGELSADDLRQIYNLIANYTYAADEPDPALFATLWARDAQYRYARDLAGIGGLLSGREAIIEAFQGFWDRSNAFDRPVGMYGRHVCLNPRIDVSDGVVTGKTSMILVFQELRGDSIGIGVKRSGLYEDRFAVEDGRWVFAERRLAYDPPERPGVQLPVELYGPVTGH